MSTSSSIARGGGSVEDLLPFSDETLCRAIAACTTPVVSAVGHEPDNPLCDLVADLRAATPTDAAKRIVPDTAAEQALRRRSARAQRARAAQLGAPRAAHPDPAAQPAGAGPAAGRADRRADEIHRARDRRPARHHPAGGRRGRPDRPPVGPAVHTGAGGHAGARLRRRAGGPAGRRRPRSCGRRPTRQRAPGCAYGSPTGPSQRSARVKNEAH